MDRPNPDAKNEQTSGYTDQSERETETAATTPFIRESVEENLQDAANFVVVFAEILSSVICSMVIIRGAAEKIPVRVTLASLFRLQITWERLIWVVIVAVYIQLNVKFCAAKYAQTQLESYNQSLTEIAIAWITVAEYVLLGITESTIVLFTCQRVKKMVSKAKKRAGKYFGVVISAAYLACNAAFAIRNFSVCLYFALLSVFVMQNEQNVLHPTLAGSFTVIVVLQTLIAAMRGSYGNVFLRLFLSYFLDDGESFASNISRLEEKELLNNEKEKKIEKENCMTQSLKETPEEGISLECAVEAK